jgi:hypothetical protein
MTHEVIFSFLGQVVSIGGGAAAIAYAVFHFLTKNWIQNQLAKDLEIAKSEISLIAARQLKLHDREHIVFPEVWSRLNDACASLGAAVSSLKESPDLDRMPEVQFKKWLESSDFSDQQREYLANEKDKNRAYNKISDWRLLVEAQGNYIKFETYLGSNRIFLDPRIKEKLDRILSLFKDVWMKKMLHWEGHRVTEGKSFLLEAHEKYRLEIQPIMIEIELLFQDRLFPRKGDPR